jgi:hypothetical protein
MANEFIIKNGFIVDSGASQLTGSLNVLGSITGSLFGTASYSNQALSSSFATTASYYVGSVISASYASTASVAPNYTLLTAFNSFTGSYNTGSFSGSFLGNHTGSLLGTSSWAISSSYAVTASYYGGSVISSSYASTASVAPNYTLITTFNSFTASYNTGSFTGSFVGSLLGTSSWASNSVTASYVLNSISSSFSSTASYWNGTVVSSSYALTASYASVAQTLLGSVVSASYALTASYALNSGNTVSQFTSSSIWTFSHNIGNRYVIVQTIDSAYNEIIPANIELTDVNTATITFPSSQSGWAIASLGGGNNTGGTGGVTINSNTNNYLLTATGTSNTINGEANLTYDGASLVFEPSSLTGTTPLGALTTVFRYSNFGSFGAGNFHGDVWRGTLNSAINAETLVYLASTGLWEKALADTTGQSGTNLLGIVLKSGASLDEVPILIHGNVRFSGVSIANPGDPIYMSDSSAGDIAITATSTSNSIIRIIGHCINSSQKVLHFNPDNSWIVVP